MIFFFEDDSMSSAEFVRYMIQLRAGVDEDRARIPATLASVTKRLGSEGSKGSSGSELVSEEISRALLSRGIGTVALSMGASLFSVLPVLSSSGLLGNSLPSVPSVCNEGRVLLSCTSRVPQE